LGYFLLLEAIQAAQNIEKYVNNFWNYLDLSGFALLIIGEIGLYINRSNGYLRADYEATN